MELTDEQLQLLEWMAAGFKDRDIASQLGLKLTTAQSRIARLKDAMGADNRAHAVGIGFRAGLLEVEPL